MSASFVREEWILAMYFPKKKEEKEDKKKNKRVFQQFLRKAFPTR